MAAWIPAAITGAATVASGLLGKGKTKTQWDFQERERLEKERFKWLVKGAQKAGFNPLTVLGATGGGLGGGPVATSTPFGVRQAIADAISAGANAYLAHDPVLDESKDVENELLRKQIAQYENEARRFGSRPIGAPVPSLRKSPSPTVSGGPADVESPYGTQAYDATGKPLLDVDSYLLYNSKDEPLELETDYFGAWRSGQLFPVIASDIERNVSPDTYDALSAYARGVSLPFRGAVWAYKKAKESVKPRVPMKRTPIIPVPDDRLDAKARRSYTGGW